MGDDLDLIAVGDSTMWGMGLNPEDKYVSLFYAYLTQKEFDITRDLKGQVGAVTGIDGDELEDQKQFCEPDKDYDKSLAEMHGRSDTERHGRKGVAMGHPSVLDQINNLPYDFDLDDEFREEEVFKATYDKPEDVEILLLTGSINDLGATLPLAAHNLQVQIDNMAECFSYEALSRVIEAANEKFPNATIYVCGYFPPSSRESRAGELLRQRAVEISAALIASGNPIGISLGFLGLILAKPAGEVLHSVNHRYEYFYKKMTHEMRRAVYEVDQSIDVPVIFVLPGYKRGNVPHVSDEFDKVNEPPPVSYREQLLYGLPIISGSFNPLEWLNGRSPPSLYNPGELTQDRIDARYEVVDKYDEVGFFSKSSSMHPNPAGARRYAKALESQHQQHFEEGWSVRAICDNLQSDDPNEDTVDVLAGLKRYGLSPGDGLRACFNMTRVDSIEVVIETGDETIESTDNEILFDVGLNDNFARRRAGDRIVSELPDALWELSPEPVGENMSTADLSYVFPTVDPDEYFEDVTPGTDYVARFNLNPHDLHPAFGDEGASWDSHAENRIRGGDSAVNIEYEENLALDPIMDDLEVIEKEFDGEPTPPFSVEFNQVFDVDEPLYLWDIDGFRIIRDEYAPAYVFWTSGWDVTKVTISINGMEVVRDEDYKDLDIEDDFVLLDIPNYPEQGEPDPHVVHVEW